MVVIRKHDFRMPGARRTTPHHTTPHTTTPYAHTPAQYDGSDLAPASPDVDSGEVYKCTCDNEYESVFQTPPHTYTHTTTLLLPTSTHTHFMPVSLTFISQPTLHDACTHPVGVIDDDGVGRCQVDPQTPGPRAQQEHSLGGVRIKVRQLCLWMWVGVYAVYVCG